MLMHVRKVTFWAMPAALLVATAGTAGAVSADSASATLSTSKAGAKAVTLTVALNTELQCGRLRGGALVLRLPAQARLPGAIAASAVLVGGKASGRVAVDGHSLRISLPPPRGTMSCDSIRQGVVKIVVASAAGLGNPRAPGTYTVRLTRGSETFAAPLKIH
jgi:hypothetical protein